MSGTAPGNREIYSVSRLNLEARSILEGSFPALWVEGEISNLARPRSGHIYFTLKDDGAQVRCAMFRMNNRRLDFEPENGMQVLLNGRVSLYAERGDYQLIAQTMEEAGAGALRRAFEALKKRLAAEGLFDAASKRPLPALPRRIGVITSPTGAAIKDVLSVLERRFAAIPVDVYPVMVQGEQAPPQVVAALKRASERAECDVLILARGGGSMEDLWAFNDERVARAIAACEIPVVAGIGHESDFTIADFVADHRAATPSAAAEVVCPDGAELRARRDQAVRRLRLMAVGRLKEERQALSWLLRRLPHPKTRIETARTRRQALLDRMERAIDGRLRIERGRIATLEAQVARHHPALRLEATRARCLTLNERLRRSVTTSLTRRRTEFAGVMRTLETLGPQATLDRGYAILRRERDGVVVRSPDDAPDGERLEARVAGGAVRVRVDGSD